MPQTLTPSLPAANITKTLGNTASEDEKQFRKVRMARVQDIFLLDQPADKEAPRIITVYLVDVLKDRQKRENVVV
jgi:hypothetical protein